MTTGPQPDIAPDTPLSKERLRLWLKLLKASSLLEDEVRRRLRAEYSGTLPRFDVMSALSRVPEGLKMSEISKMLRVSNGNVTVVVDKLAQDGLAQRVAVPGDRRANLVQLTAKGQATFAEHAAAHEAWIDDLLGGLNADDIEGMILRLDRLAETLEERDI
ncbi:HTH-type transcriptional regulator MhqR [Tritonibacter multivorans]|uniref:HTH-type transcriptional regulator MhqR n=1 Tax=Tritonibacter multivorans TaxID=928856 RepID=A0A0P1FZS3_9RHOB|nr:MarR family transcriptional regulator [Tritonibacter multivorans]MDA7422906.1 MarR family transcriptional regulator [Tritonibacter multivorans]CUH74711.1 HTH-type transcriptional regulator MhqR [Tritonibacter multivorans]SFD76214.1 transcriptional regulator, MarR family [Tritonibacter multivorans]